MVLSKYVTADQSFFVIFIFLFMHSFNKFLAMAIIDIENFRPIHSFISKIKQRTTRPPGPLFNQEVGRVIFCRTIWSAVISRTTKANETYDTS